MTNHDKQRHRARPASSAKELDRIKLQLGETYKRALSTRSPPPRIVDFTSFGEHLQRANLISRTDATDQGEGRVLAHEGNSKNIAPPLNSSP
jgi:hypothetical protein